MATDLSHTKALILIFAMPDCPACHDFLPRFKRQVQGFKAYNVPFKIYEDAGQMPDTIPSGQIPVFIYDATSPDEQLQALCDQHGINGMPTTLLMTRSATAKLDGAVDDDEIYRALVAAHAANR